MKRTKQQTAATLRGEFWGEKVDRGQREYYYYPTDRALRCFHHIHSIGEARVPPRFEVHHENEKGFLFHLVLQGELRHRLRGQTFVARAGDASLLDMAESTDYGSPVATHLIWLHFDSSQMADLYRELGADLDPILPRMDATRCRRIHGELMQLTERKEPADEPMISAWIAMLLAEMFAVRGEAGRILPGGVDVGALSEPTRRAVAYIQRFYRTPFQIKNLAKRSGLSLYHFARVFRRETGMTPKIFLNRYRIERVKVLLATTAKPVQQIAQMAGFTNAETMTALFGELTGQSPRDYRKTHHLTKKPAG